MLKTEKYKLEQGLTIDEENNAAANAKLYKNQGRKKSIEVGTDDLYSDGEDDQESDYYGTDSDNDDDYKHKGGRSPRSPSADSDDGDAVTDYVAPLGSGRKKPPKGRNLKKAKSKFNVGSGGGGRSRKKRYKPKKRRSRKKLPKVDSGSHTDDDDSY